MTYTSGSLLEILNRFATLIAAAERETCADAVKKKKTGTMDRPTYTPRQLLRTRMPKELEMIEIETGSANVYEDLGLPDAAEMQVKATLAAKIGEIIKHRHLTQTQAAEILGMPQPKLSGMLRGQFRGIGEAKMLEHMNRLDVMSSCANHLVRAAPEDKP